MSRKNKTLRAFLHQNQNPTIELAWDAAWKHAQKTFHARSMQGMEEQLEIERDYNKALVEALNLMVTTHDEGGWPTATITIARAALDAHRKQGGEL